MKLFQIHSIMVFFVFVSVSFSRVWTFVDEYFNSAHIIFFCTPPPAVDKKPQFVGEGFPVGSTSNSSLVTHPIRVQKKKIEKEYLQMVKKKSNMR